LDPHQYGTLAGVLRIGDQPVHVVWNPDLLI
jgi:hypothetical protein